MDTYLQWVSCLMLAVLCVVLGETRHDHIGIGNADCWKYSQAVELFLRVETTG